MRTVLFLFLGLMGMQAFSETRYVSDQLEITLRSGASMRHRILRMLQSGTPVEVLSVDKKTGYAQVRTQDGTTGYVLERLLMNEPVARERIATLEAQLQELQQAPDQLAAKLTKLQGEYDRLQADHQRLQEKKRKLEEELATIRRASADIVRITKERTELRQSVAQFTRKVAELQQANNDLQHQVTQRWFLIGAGVVTGGIFLGLLLPHLRFRRRRSWRSL